MVEIVSRVAILWLALASGAAGQWHADGEPLIEPVADSFYEWGVGAPTVVYQPDRQQYVMFFETRLTTEYVVNTLGGGFDRCDGVGVWAIGRATSRDGVDWVVDDEPVISPLVDADRESDGASLDSCGHVHPSAMVDGDVVRLWTMRIQPGRWARCPRGVPDPPPTFGCQVQAGIAHSASLDDGRTFTEPVVILANPADTLRVSPIAGYPSVVLHNGRYAMVYQGQHPDGSYVLFSATSPEPDDGWETDPGASLELDPTDELFGPVLNCGESGALELYVGARSTVDKNGLWVGAARDVTGPWFSSDSEAEAEAEAEAEELWTGDDSFRHWTALTAAGERRVYVTHRDSTGAQSVFLMHTEYAMTELWRPDRRNTGNCDSTPTTPTETAGDEAAEPEPTHEMIENDDARLAAPNVATQPEHLSPPPGAGTEPATFSPAVGASSCSLSSDPSSAPPVASLLVALWLLRRPRR